MTEQPDTAAIRADWSRSSRSYPAWLVLDLCDALEAARAERDRRVEWRPEWQTLVNQASLNAHRALTAEARAEAAEARISAALEILDRRDRFGSTLPHENWVDTTSVRRALTEGSCSVTEQLDTAAIRAEHEDGADVLWVDVLALCDALDAARTERDGYRAMIRPENVWRARAEAAEARIAELEQLADPELDARWCAVWQEVCAENYALEARIAAALAIHKRVELGDYLDGSPMPDVCLACPENNVAGKKLWPCPTVRALTEGTTP